MRGVAKEEEESLAERAAGDFKMLARRGSGNGDSDAEGDSGGGGVAGGDS